LKLLFFGELIALPEVFKWPDINNSPNTIAQLYADFPTILSAWAKLKIKEISCSEALKL
jgi:hypothetical protein